MAVIDIGNEAINRSGFVGQGLTIIDGTNPANTGERITSVSIWAKVTMLYTVVGIFYRPDPEGYTNNFTARCSQSIGTVEAGAKRTFEVDLEVEEGDFIGIYCYSAGELEGDPEGGISWNKSGNKMACDDFDFGAPGDAIYSFGGSGFTPTTPTVTTQAATGIKNVYCTGNGNITDEGYANITERGFEYGLAEEAQFYVKQTGADLGGGAFAMTITGLQPSTPYYYRAYATNSEGDGYGDWVLFTTGASLSYGMYEEDNSATLCFYVRKVGGKWSIKHGPYTEDQSDIEITKILTEGKGKYQIKFESDVLTGISAGVMCKVDIKAR